MGASRVVGIWRAPRRPEMLPVGMHAPPYEQLLEGPFLPRGLEDVTELEHMGVEVLAVVDAGIGHMMQPVTHPDVAMHEKS